MKKEITLIAIVVAIIIAGAITVKCIHCNDFHNFQIIQSMSGNIEIRKEGGYYLQMFPRIWTYPKKNNVLFSNNKQESTDNDAIEVTFNNKGKGTVDCQVGYSLCNDDESITNMHSYAHGDIDIVDREALSIIKETISIVASRFDSSQAIEMRTDFAIESKKMLSEHPGLKKYGIVIEELTINTINPDSVTEALFQSQQKADLEKRTAEAEKQRLIMEKERTEAEYAKQIAEEKGKAEAEMMKATTNAEREKKLAEIEAQKKVEVEKLAKEEALVKANKQLELAEIQKKEESTKLETIKIQAEQKIAEAHAKKQEIELSGAITESEKIKLEIDMKTKIGVAQAIATGFHGVKLPETIIIGNGDKTNASSTFENLMQLMIVEKAKEINKDSGK